MSNEVWILGSDLNGMRSVRIYENEKVPALTQINNPSPKAGDFDFKVDSTTDYVKGDFLLIDRGGADEEIVQIRSVKSATELVIVQPLVNAQSNNADVEKLPDLRAMEITGWTHQEQVLTIAQKESIASILQTAVDDSRTALGF